MKIYLGPYCDSGDQNDREVSIDIHEYDSWNADHTIALIALPIIQQLRLTTHGSPYVSNEDVPEHLHHPEDFDFSNGDVDDLWHVRWGHVLGEIIYAMDHTVNPEWEDEFTIDTHPTEYHEIAARIKNGYVLFGKYYQALWD